MNGGRGGAGADVEALTADGETALHASAQHGAAEAIVALVQSGAWVNATNPKGITPLHWAAVNGQTDAVKVRAQAPPARRALRGRWAT